MIILDPLNFRHNILRAGYVVTWRLLPDSYFQAHCTAVVQYATTLISLENHLGPWYVLTAVSVLTTQLRMSSLNIYHQFMYFRVSFSSVRFSRSPQPKPNDIILYYNKYKYIFRIISFFCVFAILVLYLHKFCIDVILSYVS